MENAALAVMMIVVFILGYFAVGGFGRFIDECCGHPDSRSAPKKRERMQRHFRKHAI